MTDQHRVRPGHARRLVRVAALFLVALTSRTQAQSDTLWQYSSPSKIVSRRLQEGSPQLLVISEDHVVALDPGNGSVVWDVPHSIPVSFVSDDTLGHNLVGAGTSITAVDYRTGKQLWARSGFPHLDSSYVLLPDDGKMALLQSGSSLWAFDPATGAAAWNSLEAMPGSVVRDFVLLRESGLVLLFLEGPGGKGSLAAVSRDSGTTRWYRDGLFSEAPAFRTRNGVSSLKNYQLLATRHDSLLVVYVTTDGPVRLDVVTGVIRWRSAVLRGRKVAGVAQDYMPMCLCAGSILVPVDRGVVALDPETGALRWEAPLPDKPTAARRRPQGLLLFGLGVLKSYATLLDSASGAPRWKLGLSDVDKVLLDRDSLLAAHDEKLLAIEIATGSQRILAKVEFGDHEQPRMLAPRPGGGYLLVSRQNLAAVGPEGLLYQRFYRAPPQSFGERLIATSIRRKGRAQLTPSVFYSLTDTPDASGVKYYSVVAVGTADGAELRRLPVQSRDPDYVLDSWSGKIFLIVDNRRVVARTFALPKELIPSGRDEDTGAAADSAAFATESP